VTVRKISDVRNIPTIFDENELLFQLRQAFDNSGLRIYRLINVVYVVYKYLDNYRRPRRSRRLIEQQQQQQ